MDGWVVDVAGIDTLVDKQMHMIVYVWIDRCPNRNGLIDVDGWINECNEGQMKGGMEG